VLTNWHRCRGTPALVTMTLVSFYFICYILFDSPGDSTGYRDDSTGDLHKKIFRFRFPHKVKFRASTNFSIFFWNMTFFCQELFSNLVSISSS
jgi:hypothetical protein